MHKAQDTRHNSANTVWVCVCVCVWHVCVCAEIAVVTLSCWDCCVEVIQPWLFCWESYLDDAVLFSYVVMLVLILLRWHFYVVNLVLGWLSWECCVEFVVLGFLCWGCYAAKVALRVLCWDCYIAKSITTGVECKIVAYLKSSLAELSLTTQSDVPADIFQ